MNERLVEMKEKYGTVEYEGKEYILTENAYAVNTSTDTINRNGNVKEIEYRASAEDEEGNEYMVIWETTTEFDEAQELFNLEYADENGELDDEEKERMKELLDSGADSAYCEEESNACDWDNPISVTEI